MRGNMIDRRICEKIIARVLASGADYAEIYAEDKKATRFP